LTAIYKKLRRHWLVSYLLAKWRVIMPTIKNGGAEARAQVPDLKERLGSLDAKLAQLDARLERNKADLARNSATLETRLAELMKRLVSSIK
jgi:hypothetical protein